MSTNYHTPISTSAPADATVFNAPLGQLDSQLKTTTDKITNLEAGAESMIQLNFGAPAALSIAAGAVTVTQSYHTLDTEGLAAFDDLDTINGGAAGDFLRLRIVNNARAVRIRNLIGNISLASQDAVWLDTTNKSIDLVFDATVGAWIESITPIALKPSVFSGAQVTAQILTLPHKIYKPVHAFNARNAAYLHVQPRWSARGSFGEQASNATYASWGMAAGTDAGAGAKSNLTDAQASDDIYTNQAIALAAATFGGRKSTTFNLVRRHHNPYFYTKLRLRTDLTNLRVWLGLCQAQVTNLDVLAAGTAGCFFRFSTVAGDTSWKAICNDGINQSTPAATGVGAALDTTFEFEIWVDDSGGFVHFSVNGSTDVIVSTNLPAAGQDLGWTVSGISNGVTAKDIAIARVYVDFG